MRRQPVARSFRRAPVQEARFNRTARPETIPSPVGGWNARDHISSMKSTDAVFLDNWFPGQSAVRTRPGYDEHCNTAESGQTIRTLMSFEYTTFSKMLAAVNGKILDVTTSTPASLATGLGSDYYVNELFGGRLFMANGVDSMKTYDGTTVANSTFTGPTLSDISFVREFKGRIYVVQKNTQKMWYGGVGSVTGAMTLFDFSTVASVRGNLMILARLKGDGGDGGTDDVFLAIFEGGDVIAYSGSNPGDSNNWALIGKYKIGRPLSRFAVYNGDDDVYIATTRGYEKLTEIVKFGASLPEKLLMSGKIQGAVIDDIAFLGASDTWNMHLFPGAQMLIVNVPRTGTARCYHVRNINTGAWCRFKDFNAYGWAMLGRKCYFGSNNGKVYEFSFSYTSDDGAEIVADGQTAWNNLGYPGYIKQCELARFTFTSSYKPSSMLSVGVDYATPSIIDYEAPDTGALYYWDTSYWDAAYWSGGERTYQAWVSRNATGHTLSLRARVSVGETAVKWASCTILYSLGGPI